MYTKKRLPKGTPSNPSPSLHTPHYYLTSLINEVKASQHLSDKSYDTITTISDELFNILNQITMFSNQVTLMLKKNQNIDTLFNRTKINLSNEIASFFDSLSLFGNNSTSTKVNLYKIKKESFMIKGNKLDLDDSVLYYDEYSNEDIIEKIKKKIESTKSIKNYKTFYSYRNYNTTKTTPTRHKPKISLKYPMQKRINTEYNHMKVKSTKDIRRIKKKEEQRLYSRSYSKTEFNRSFGGFGNEQIQQNFFNGIIIHQTGPKPSNYTTYLMNKSRGVIDSYNKISERKRNNYSFNDSFYSNVMNRPKSSCRRLYPKLYY